MTQDSDNDLWSTLDPDALADALLRMPDLAASELIARGKERGQPIPQKLLDVAGDRAAAETLRERALWLLKEACEPRATRVLVAILNTEEPSSSLASRALDALERLAFAEIVSDVEIRAVDQARLLGTSSTIDKWLGLLGTLRGDWARDELVRWTGTKQCKQAIEALLVRADPSSISAAQAALSNTDIPADDPLWADLYRVQAELATHAGKQVDEQLALRLAETLRLAVLCHLAEQRQLTSEAVSALGAYVWPTTLRRPQRKLLDRLRRALLG